MLELNNAGEFSSVDSQLLPPCALRIALKYSKSEITPSILLVKQVPVSSLPPP